MEDSKDFSECSDWDTDLEEQDRQKKKLENKEVKKNENTSEDTQNPASCTHFSHQKMTCQMAQ